MLASSTSFIIAEDRNVIADILERQSTESGFAIERKSRDGKKMTVSSIKKFKGSMVEANHFYGEIQLTPVTDGTELNIKTRGNSTFLLLAVVSLIAIIPTAVVGISTIQSTDDRLYASAGIFLLCLVPVFLAILKQRNLALGGMRMIRKCLNTVWKLDAHPTI